jgi:hypothetical protein
MDRPKERGGRAETRSADSLRLSRNSSTGTFSVTYGKAESLMGHVPSYRQQRGLKKTEALSNVIVSGIGADVSREE